MEDKDRFDRAIDLIDQANAQDPRTEDVEGVRQPRELTFARRTYTWVEKLSDHPSEALLLAARAHTLRRWSIPRDRYEMNTVGYHEWRNALAAFHAEEAGRILADVGYQAATIDKVKKLITKADWPNDPDGRVLEDADCLVFIETKLSDYLDEWDDAKMFRVLSGTYQKMTPAAQKQIQTLQLGQRERKLLADATGA